MHNEMSGQWFLNRKMMKVETRERVTEEEERVSIWGESTEIKLRRYIARLSSSKNFICKRKNLIFSKFNIVHLKDWSNTFAFICLLLDIGYRSTDVKSKSRDQSFSTHEDYTVHFSSAALFGNWLQSVDCVGYVKLRNQSIIVRFEQIMTERPIQPAPWGSHSVRLPLRSRSMHRIFSSPAQLSLISNYIAPKILAAHWSA